MSAVGQNVKRKDGIGKATGRVKYADDLAFPGMIYGQTIRSTIPAGRVTGIQYDFDRTGFTICEARDIPGKNIVALIVDDQPCLVDGVVRHPAEPIALIAHEDRDKLLAANVVVSYEKATPIFDPIASTKILKELLIEKGNLEKGFASADVIVEGTYRTGHQEHVYIETNGVIAVPDGGQKGVTVYGSIQCPFYVDKALRVMLGPGYSVRVVQTETGGGFGGKEEYPSMLACHAALLALKSGRPVKMIYDRVEDMLATTKRHPSYVRHKTGLKKDGRITAMDVDVVIDGGAYVTLSPVVLSRGGIHAAGPYRCANTRIRGRAMFTNTPPNGAFRGFGAPQTQFAMEVHMERIAETLGIDPVKLREKNALRAGDITATGQKLREDCSAIQVLKEAVKRSGYRRKIKKLKADLTADSKADSKAKGIGVALFYHGSGFTGSGELKLGSKASVEVTERGVRLLVSSTEIGQGTRTMHAQIVADAMGLPYDVVEVAPIDTSIVPDSGPTVASRTTMVVGKILERAAIELKEKLGGMAPHEYFKKKGALRVEKTHEPPAWLKWDEERYRGDAYATFAWACNVAEVEMDRDTYEVRPVRLTAVADIGRAIHPALAKGQIEGGTAQGVGFATIEQVVMKNGAMANAQLTNYTIPTTLDTPAMDVVIVENPFPEGPFGAKGLGELPIDGPAPAIVNAIRSLKIDVREVPATPELVLSALGSRQLAEKHHDVLTYGAPVRV